MTTTPRPHELIPTQALLEELFARYETAVFAGHASLVPEAGLERIRVNWRGNLVTVLALAARLTHQVNATLDGREMDAAEEEGGAA